LVVSKLSKLKIHSSSLIVVSCFLSTGSVAHPDAKGVVKERMVTMKALASSMKALNQVKSGQMPITASSKISEKIIELSKLIPKQFPAGTYSFPSEASPKIESERARFERIAANLREAASTIPKTAQAGDLEKFTSSFRDIGKTCSACHKAFRVTRQR
jgi:cytochrome c556